MARPNNAGAISAHVEGVKAAKAKFAALPEVTRNRAIDVNSATAAAVVLGAKQRLQASPSIQTRSLFDHVKWKINKSTGVAIAGVTSGSTTIAFGHMGGITKNVRVKGIVIAGRGGSALTSKGAKVIRPSRYAHLVEFGTVHFAAEPFQGPSAAAQVAPHLQRWRAAGRQIERDLSVGLDTAASFNPTGSAWSVNPTAGNIGGGRL